MGRKYSRTTFSVGQLVDAAYEEAERLTKNPKLAALLANKVLEQLLTSSDRADLAAQLHKVA